MRVFFKGLFFLCVIYLAAASQASAANLYTVVPGVRSSADAVIPISQSLAEWELSFNMGLVAGSTTAFDIVIPDEQGNTEMYSVERVFYREYDSGEIQWVGRVLPNTPFASEEYFGMIIVNKINNSAYAVISIVNDNYEIYSDSQVGTRLAKVYLPDLSLDSVTVAGGTGGGGGLSFGAPAVSDIDVLVLIDDDLNTPTIFPLIRNRIISEKLNADAILALSGSPGNRGVPINLNIVGIDPINIPQSLEDITCAINVNPIVCPAFNEMTDEVSAISQELITRRNNSGADLVALYIPFDPDVHSDPMNFGEFCGVAGLPEEPADDSDFASSFTLHASTCTTAQLVFFHEILHNFGSSHVSPEMAFTSYARGFNVFSADPAFSTMMGCTGGLDNQDPSETDCNRILRLSSSQDTFDGFPIGDANADNVLFLSECVPAGPCRRDQVANRGAGNGSDSPPTVNILTPVEDAVIPPDNSFELTASAMDMEGSVSVTWSYSQNGGISQIIGQGTGSNFSISTSIFQNTGEFLVSASALDNGGQITVDSHHVSVVNQADVSISVFETTLPGFIPVVRVEVTNLGPDTANDIVFNMHASSGDGSGFAGIPSLPPECIIVTDETNPLDVEYRCHISTLAISSTYSIDWTELCPAPFTERNDPVLFFEVAVESLDEIDDNAGNDTDTAYYWNNLCYPE